MVSHWLSVCPSVCPSICLTSVRPSICVDGQSFPDDNLSKCQWIFTKHGVCPLILWRAGLGLLMGKFRQFLTVICLRQIHIFISR